MGRCVTTKMISRYLDGDLEPEVRRPVEIHLAECARCAKTLAEMRAMDDAIRQSAVAPAVTPDVASRVTAELRHRGAFFRARMAAGNRRLFGESLFSRRMAAALVAAAALVVVAFLVADRLTERTWARRAAPVVADAERVLVRLVFVDPSDAVAAKVQAREEASRLVWAREESRKLALSARLAEAQSGASPAVAKDLAYLETTFTLLAAGRPLPPNLEADLKEGGALVRAKRLHESLAPGG